MIHTHSLLFAARLNDIVSVLVALAFFVIWVINQINDARKKQAAQEQRKQAEAARQPADLEAAAAAPAPPPDPLRSQVDEFLRRAGKQPAAPPPRAAAAPRGRGQDEVVVLLDESVAAPQRKTLSERMRTAAEAAPPRRQKSPGPQMPVDPKVLPRQRVTPPQRSKSVADSVAQHVTASAQNIQKEAADLGKRVKLADEQFDRQLQQKFDHELGSLSSRTAAGGSAPAPAAEKPLTPAAQIAALLANPDGIRQAVILNEILRRPSDRW